MKHTTRLSNLCRYAIASAVPLVMAGCTILPIQGGTVHTAPVQSSLTGEMPVATPDPTSAAVDEAKLGGECAQELYYTAKPSCSMLYVVRASKLLSQNKPEEAMKAVGIALALDNTSTEARSLQSAIQNRVAQLDKAQKYFDLGVKQFLEAKRSSLDLQIGYHISRPAAQNAYQSFSLAIENEPHMAMAYVYRAATSLFLGANIKTVMADLNSAARADANIYTKMQGELEEITARITSYNDD